MIRSRNLNIKPLLLPIGCNPSLLVFSLGQLHTSSQHRQSLRHTVQAIKVEYIGLRWAVMTNHGLVRLFQTLCLHLKRLHLKGLHLKHLLKRLLPPYYHHEGTSRNRHRSGLNLGLHPRTRLDLNSVTLSTTSRPQ